jgi:cytochrome c peroxidase
MQFASKRAPKSKGRFVRERMQFAILMGTLGVATGLACSSSDTAVRLGSQMDASTDSSVQDASSYSFRLPPDFPPPAVPADNPMSEAKVELGRHLFYDKRLSGNGTYACATCHEQARAFTDGKALAIGSTGDAHPRNSMSLANVAYTATLGWANPATVLLEAQALTPMFGENPVELGLAGQEDALLTRLSADATYQKLAARAFPSQGNANGGASKLTLAQVTQALASFERVLISGNSPYDAFTRGNASAINEDAKKGRELFFSERFECFHCHGGFAFADSINHEGKVFREQTFHNNGLYNIDGKGGYPPNNPGLREFTNLPADTGRMKAPTLRNVEVTAPYMHDGSIATLEEVLQHYEAGGRTLRSGPYAGNGSKNPFKSEFVHGFDATPEELAQLLAFLKSLTDREFLTNPAFANPWPR